MTVCGFREASRTRWNRGVLGTGRERGWRLSVRVGKELEIRCHVP